jgi:hypothetical protein
MGNMSYCRFENTYHDLRDCAENWDVESEDEKIYQQQIIKLCKEIVGHHIDELE